MGAAIHEGVCTTEVNIEHLGCRHAEGIATMNICAEKAGQQMMGWRQMWVQLFMKGFVPPR